MAVVGLEPRAPVMPLKLCILTHETYILWVRIHHFKGITGARGSIPTTAIGLLLSETLFEIFSSLMCLLKAASCINIPKYYLTQNFIHFPPPTEDYLVTNTSFSCPNNDFKCATNYQTPCISFLPDIRHFSLVSGKYKTKFECFITAN